MRRGLATGIVAAGAAAVIAVGSGLTAWANWSVETASGLATLQGDVLPRVGKPTAELVGGVPKVSWVGVRFPSGAAVGGYAVVRHVGNVQGEVCQVGSATLTCADGAAEAGSSVTYTVRAVAGDRWAGVASPASESVVVPGGAVAGRSAGGDGEGAKEGFGDAGKKDGSGGDGEGVGGAVQPTTSPGPGPTSSAPSAPVESVPTGTPVKSLPTSLLPSPSVTASGDGEVPGKG